MLRLLLVELEAKGNASEPGLMVNGYILKYVKKECPVKKESLRFGEGLHERHSIIHF